MYLVKKQSAEPSLIQLLQRLLRGTQTITLNFNVPAGTGYKLYANADCKSLERYLNAVYPYNTSDWFQLQEILHVLQQTIIISITGR